MKEIRLCDDGDINTAFKLCEKYNLGVEIQGFHNPYIENKEKLKLEYIEKFKNINGGRSYHAPYWDLNLGTKIVELQEAMIKIYNEAYSIARELKCSEIVIHSNYKPGTDWYNGWITRAEKILERFLKDKDDSITICIENQFETDSELLINLIDEVNDNRVKICLDIGHAHANSNMTVEKWVETLGNRIAYYHLHNNHGKQTIYGYNKDDEHLGLNNRTIDIKNVLDLAERITPNAVWNIESKPQYLQESVDFLRRLEFIK